MITASAFWFLRQTEADAFGRGFGFCDPREADAAEDPAFFHVRTVVIKNVAHLLGVMHLIGSVPHVSAGGGLSEKLTVEQERGTEIEIQGVFGDKTFFLFGGQIFQEMQFTARLE